MQSHQLVVSRTSRQMFSRTSAASSIEFRLIIAGVWRTSGTTGGHLFAVQRQCQPPRRGSIAVFAEIDSLPCSQHQSTVADGDRERRTHQRGFHVGRHVVRAFNRVLVRKILGRQMIERGFQVAQHVRVGVLIDRERGGRLLDEDVQQADADWFHLGQRRRHFVGDDVQSAATGLERQVALLPAHAVGSAIWAFQRSQWSASTMATIASAIGTKRGKRHGSCRPLVRIVVGWPSSVTVCCSIGRLLVGLTAARRTSGIPLVMPPSMPPWRLVSVVTAGWPDFRGAEFSAGRNRSLFWLPRSVTQPKPIPYSTPRTAGRLKRALARSALILSNTGSPSPGGTPVATISAAPPIESPWPRRLSISETIRAAACESGQRTMFGWPSGSFSTCSSVTAAGSGTSATTSPTCLTYPTTSPPKAARISFLATTPAATRTVVSRALERPPPR